MRRKELYSTPDYWNAKAEEHDSQAASMWPNNNLNRHYHREQSEAIDRLLPDVSGWKILDIGCGTGRMARYFASRGAQVRGFDFSDKAIGVAKGIPLPAPVRPEIAPVEPSYEVRSVFSIDYPPEFDLAFTWGALTIACKERAELRRVLPQVVSAVKPGGNLLFLEPIHRGMLTRVLSLPLDDFLADLGEAGAEILEVRGLHFWPARVALAYAPLPRWITDPAYRVGQKFLANPGWGDYKLIFARRAR